MKKTVSLTLALVLCLSMFSVPSIAAEVANPVADALTVTVEDLLARNNITLDETTDVAILPYEEAAPASGIRAMTQSVSSQGDVLQITTVSDDGEQYETTSIIPYVEMENGSYAIAAITYVDTQYPVNTNILSNYMDVLMTISFRRFLNNGTQYYNPESIRFSYSPKAQQYLIGQLSAIYITEGDLYAFSGDTANLLNTGFNRTFGLSVPNPTPMQQYITGDSNRLPSNWGIQRGFHGVQYHIILQNGMSFNNTVPVYIP